VRMTNWRPSHRSLGGCCAPLPVLFLGPKPHRRRLRDVPTAGPAPAGLDGFADADYQP
jgi:hypothetical protein